MNRIPASWRANLPAPFSMFQREMDDLVDRFFHSNTGGSLMAAARTDLAELDDRFEIAVELPGLTTDDIEVELKDGALWISGEKKEDADKTGKNFLRVERQYGRFQHVIPLAGAVDVDHVTAEFLHGVLKVSVPKAESAKPKRIPVRSENPVRNETFEQPAQ
jgi:HSP20 family protein